MYKDSHFKSARNAVHKRRGQWKAQAFASKFSGILPDHQLLKLNEMNTFDDQTISYKNATGTSNGVLQSSKQSSIRQNLITEADFRDINIKLK